jgi:hypothetical protein
MPHPSIGTPHTPIGSGLLPGLHQGNKRENRPLRTEDTGYGTHVLDAL